MEIEDMKIKDAADANYVIKKFFDNDYKKIEMTRLEQLVLAVYSMGKKKGVSTDSAPDEIEPKSAVKVPEKTNPFKINDVVKIFDDIEIGHSGVFIKANNAGRVTSVKGDTVTVLFEEGEEGEMIEVNVLFEKLEKIS